MRSSLIFLCIWIHWVECSGWVKSFTYGRLEKQEWQGKLGQIMKILKMFILDLILQKSFSVLFSFFVIESTRRKGVFLMIYFISFSFLGGRSVPIFLHFIRGSPATAWPDQQCIGLCQNGNLQTPGRQRGAHKLNHYTTGLAPFLMISKG